MRSQNRKDNGTQDLVEELIGEEIDDNHTHKPEGSYAILNDIVVDRGPSPSKSSFIPCSTIIYSS
jgi:NAD+ kinase